MKKCEFYIPNNLKTIESRDGVAYYDKNLPNKLSLIQKSMFQKYGTHVAFIKKCGKYSDGFNVYPPLTMTTQYGKFELMETYFSVSFDIGNHNSSTCLNYLIDFFKLLSVNYDMGHTYSTGGYFAPNRETGLLEMNSMKIKYMVESILISEPNHYQTPLLEFDNDMDVLIKSKKKKKFWFF